MPPAAGLSSSAALGVAAALAFDRVFELGLAPRELALAAHAGESDFVGIGCGILDPFASALGRADHVLRIDCRDRSVTWLPVPPVALLVAHSGVERRLAEAGYAERVAECRAAFAAAKQAGLVAPGATALRDLGSDALRELAPLVPEVVFRRARHVVRENARVDAVCAALAGGELAQVGELLREGQASLREDYDASLPEIDLLCRLGDAHDAVYGSRLTGAGWGGCTLHLVRPASAAEVAADLAGGYRAETGRRLALTRLLPASGAGDA